MYYTFEIPFRDSPTGLCMLAAFVLCFIFRREHGWQEPVRETRSLHRICNGRGITESSQRGRITGLGLQPDMPLQVFGQICVPFMIIFSGLSVLGIFLSGYLAFYLYKEVKPSYHIL